MGLAATERFSKLGDTVYILGRHLEKLQKAADRFENVFPVVCDATDLQSVENAVKTITSEHKKIDALVNNAGGRSELSIAQPSPAEALQIWNEVITKNLTSVYLITSHFEPFIANNGRIIIISSLAAFTGSSQGGPTGAAYAAAKSGIHGLMRTFVKQFGERGITINAIAPGVVDDTDFFDEGKVPDRVKAAYTGSMKIKRVGTPDDIAAGIIYLTSEDAGYVTGEILNINGGVQFGR